MAGGGVRLAFASCTSVGFVLVVAAVVVTGAAVMGVPAEGGAALDSGAAVVGTGAAVVGTGAVVALSWAAVVTGAAVVVTGAKVVAGAWVLVAGPAVLVLGAGLLVGTAAAPAAGAEAGTGPVPGGHSAALVAGSTSASGRPHSATRNCLEEEPVQDKAAAADWSTTMLQGCLERGGRLLRPAQGLGAECSTVRQV